MRCAIGTGRLIAAMVMEACVQYHAVFQWRSENSDNANIPEEEQGMTSEWLIFQR
jgi:hypothetical protein